MLLLPSRKSALKESNENMILSQIHSFITNANSNCDEQREDNNNTVIDGKDVMRTPPSMKCRFFGFSVDHIA